MDRYIMNIPRSHLIAQVSDMYKDLYGERPYYVYDWDEMDQDDLYEAIKELRKELRNETKQSIQQFTRNQY